MTEKEVEEMLGRKMSTIEKTVYDLMSKKDNYTFVVDDNGNLMAVLKEE